MVRVKVRLVAKNNSPTILTPQHKCRVTSLGNWLFWAYLLEMKGMNTFIQLYIASIVFFFANVATLITTCQSYMPTTKDEEALTNIQ